MIAIMVNITMFFLASFTAIMFLCACLLGICVLDYILDADIKKSLQKEFGVRDWIKKLRARISTIIKQLDKPTLKEDVVYYTPEETEAIINDILTDEEAEYLETFIEENPDKGELVLTSWSYEKKMHIMDIFNKSKTYDAVAIENSDGQHIIKYERIG